MRLRHLEADRAAADDDQMAGALTQFKHRLIRQIADLVEAWDRRHGR